ncbi:MAG: hypothetical protein IKK85_06475 [Clostridia bacterium]|nr:hypothetical protein [Clostridia bacterium]
MNKKAIKKIIAFLKMLKAPAKMLPYIVGLVIGIIRRITDEDDAALVDLTEQGFVCRKSEQIVGGCGSPAATLCSNGSVAVAFACERVKDDSLVSSLCLVRAKDCKQVSAAGRRFLFDTPLQLGNVTLTQVSQGLLVSWRVRSNAYLHMPTGLEPKALEKYKANNKYLFDKFPEEQKQGGSFYALVPENGAEITAAFPAPASFTQGPCVLSGGEMLWLGVKDGKAWAYISKDVCKGFSLVAELPKIAEGRAVSHACCAKLKNGRILAVLCSAGEFYAVYSDDLGKRWTVPKPLEIKGTAPNLCVRDDGVAVLSFVQPEKKFAVRCCVNKDGESDWCKVRLLVSSTADKMRRPYTAAVNDEFYTVSRQRFCGEKESSIVFTLWKPLKEDYDPVAEAENRKQEKKNKRRKKKDAAV